MRPSTEDLLKIRDGELVDATVRAAVDADPRLRAEVELLSETREALQALPAFEPPAGVWQKIARDTAADTAPSSHWLLRGAIAATVAVAAILLVSRAPETPVVPPLSTTVVEVAPLSGDSLTRSMIVPTTYTDLVNESARLERLLGEITYQPRLVNAGTASTITALEDRIGRVDQSLMYARAYGLEPRQTEALWRERVDLMNALINVRYAQAQRFGY